MAAIELKRIYEDVEKNDGVRVLVDRLWPRGVSKDKAKLDHWLKEIGPSDELRKAFHQEKITFNDFEKKYKQELKSGEQQEAMSQLRKIVKDAKNNVSLLFSAKDEKHNNAVVLKKMLS